MKCDQRNSILFLGTLLLFISTIPAKAQTELSSVGIEFWVGFMDNAQGPAELEVFISSNQNTSGTISIPQQGWSMPFTVTANIATTLTIPWALVVHDSSEVVKDKGVKIESLDPISVFAISRQEFSSDATTVYPVGSLGTDYMVHARWGIAGFNGLYKSEFLIVATEDGTQIEIIPSDTTESGQPPGVPFTVSLNAGESYQVKPAPLLADLSGTIVQATDSSGPCRPFAVFSGANCTNVPNNCTACDHIYAQNIPVPSWGNSYTIVPFSLTLSYSFRILALENNTSVSINNLPPIILEAGEVLEQNSITEPICISTDAPVSVVQLMEGLSCADTGDPSMVMVNPDDHGIDAMSFVVPPMAFPSGFFVNVVMESGNIGQLVLDGAQVSISEFAPMLNCPTKSYAQLPLSVGNHVLEAPNGFLAYVYGLGSADSYVYSLGTSPVPVAIEVDSVVCSYDTVTLYAPLSFNSPFWTLLSDPLDTLGFNDSLVVFPGPVQIYVVHGLDQTSGCFNELNISVGTPDPPILSLTASASEVCQFQSVQLNADVVPWSPNNTISWEPALEVDDPTVADPSAYPADTTWFVVTVSTPGGCSIVSDSVLVSVTDGNITELEAFVVDPVLCAGESTPISTEVQQVVFFDDFNAGSSLANWGNVQGGAVNTICGSVSGEALYFNGGIERFAETPLLDVSNGGSISFALKIADGIAPCDDAAPGEDVELEYSLNNGSTWNSILLLLENGFPEFENVIVIVPVAAQTNSTKFRWRQATFSGPGQANWVLDNVLISASTQAGLTFSWTPASSVSNPSIGNPNAFPTQSGPIYLTVTDTSTQCIYSDSLYFEVGQPFTLSLVVDSVDCETGNYQLNAEASGGAGHTWSWLPDDGSLNDTQIEDPIANPNATTTYFVTATSAGDCSALASITVEPWPLLDLGPDLNICVGDTAILDAGISFISYLWNDLSVAQTLPVSTADIYSVFVLDTAGCLYSDSVNVVVNPLPDPPEIVTLDSITLLTFAPGPLQWFLNGIAINGATLPSLITTQPGIYLVVKTDISTGCVSISEPFFLGVTGIPINSGSEIRIGPNPFIDNVYVVGLNTSANFELTIHAPDGKLVYYDRSNERKIDLSHLAAGAYVLELKSDKFEYVQRIVKEK